VITHAFVRTSLALASVAVATTAMFSVSATTQVAQAAPTSAAAASASQKTILHATFNSTKRGAVDAKSFNSLLGPTNTNASAYAGMIYRKDYRGSGNVVRTTLTKGKTIHDSGAGHGNVLMVKLPGSYDSACMSYDVRFAGPDVDFSAGGKLPGLVGVAPGTAPSTPEGGGSTAHGWSGRLMWLGSKMWGMVRSAHATNLVVTYLYHPGQGRDYGDNISWGTSLKPNVWHHVKQCHVMNTVGRSDGVLQTWFDKKLVVDQHDVVYRTDPKVHITNFDWSIFRGGADAVWAGTTTSYVDIDNLLVTAA
jgi:hypothetical protein